MNEQIPQVLSRPLTVEERGIARPNPRTFRIFEQ